LRSSSEILKSALAAATKTLESLANLDEQLAKAADLIERSLRAENKLLVCGNGGSAADAAHFATELVVRFAKDRRAYPAICLASDGGLLSAAGNDYGFDEIFARQVTAFGRPGDVLICLTTSGKSKNVVRALEEAKARKLKTIAFLGRDGGSTIGMADRGRIFGRTWYLGLGPRRSFNVFHHASSGPAPRNSMKRNAAPILVQTTTRSLHAW